VERLSGIFLVMALLGAATSPAQPVRHPDAQIRQAIQRAYAQQQWTDVVRLAQPLVVRSADINFDYGMALAHLGRMKAARAALLAGRRQSPRDRRFPIELAGVAFEQKRYPQAAAWLRRGLNLDPKDQYANDFAGTVYYLMGNLPAALRYWNRIGKPYLSALDVSGQLRVHRLLLERAFTFSPAAVLKESQFQTSSARLNALGIFPEWKIDLNARPDGKFGADFHGIERDGFGPTPLQAAVSIFSGLPYETIYPGYDNMGRSAMNAQSLLRWDDQKRRAWLSLSAPLHDLPEHRWQMFADMRNENWAIRRSFTGTAPVLGSLNLQWQRAGASVASLTSGRFSWRLGAEFSHRSYRNVVDGSALTSQLVLPGYGLALKVEAEGKPIDQPQRRLYVTMAARSETGRLWSSPPHLYQRLQGSVLAHWFPCAQTNTWEVSQRLRGGGLLGTYPFDQLFLLGVERDTNLWLRGHIGTRDGRKGSAPLGDRYFLANSDLYRRVYGNGLIEVQAGPLFDVGRMGAPTTGLSTSQWLFDTGIEAKLTVLGTPVILTWGHDLRSGSNAFFGTAQ
jgi:tetratricopeptide (TPR) repeat protein